MSSQFANAIAHYSQIDENMFMNIHLAPTDEWLVAQFKDAGVSLPDDASDWTIIAQFNDDSFSYVHVSFHNDGKDSHYDDFSSGFNPEKAAKPWPVRLLEHAATLGEERVALQLTMSRDDGNQWDDEKDKPPAGWTDMLGFTYVGPVSSKDEAKAFFARQAGVTAVVECELPEFE